jgi:signal transduction histidine kinase
MTDLQLHPQETTVLIVDDTPANIDVLSQILEEEGYTISVATNGQAALELAPMSHPDLILLDVMMPGIDGFETCRQLKANEETASIPVIFITAKSETEDVIQGFSLGGVDYISKPFRHEEVCARIRNHLQMQNLLRQLEIQNKELLELNKLKNQFLGIAAHDLRGPLTSIKGFSRFLIDDSDKLPKETRLDFTENIHLASKVMLNLIGNLLDVSVIESGALQLDLQLASFKDLILQQARLHQFSAGKKNIALNFELDDIPHCTFDPNRIGQVLDNLISNAIKFSPPGTTVLLQLEQNDDFTVFSIQDEGPGITLEDQEKLFHQFQKLSARPTAGESSHGLGLSIAKIMVEAHHGKLEFFSKVGEGATFRLSLPRSTQE